jgi:hypothetical protein
MGFSDALDEMIRKEEEGKARMQKAMKKAEEIRYRGEEEASEIYQRTRDGLKKKTVDYTKQMKKRLEKLERELGKELAQEKKRITASAGKKRKAAGEAAYDFMVGLL